MADAKVVNKTKVASKKVAPVIDTLDLEFMADSVAFITYLLKKGLNHRSLSYRKIQPLYVIERSIQNKANFSVVLKYQGLTWYVTRENWDFDVRLSVKQA